MRLLNVKNRVITENTWPNQRPTILVDMSLMLSAPVLLCKFKIKIVAIYDKVAVIAISPTDTDTPQKIMEFATPKISGPISVFSILIRATGKDWRSGGVAAAEDGSSDARHRTSMKSMLIGGRYFL
jgi:hypothetical protein